MGNFSRVDLYLRDSIKKYYQNTDIENELVEKFDALYRMAKDAHERNQLANPKNIEKWRKAYHGTLNALTKDGDESKRKGRTVKKTIFELVESKVDNSIPMPNMKPRYKMDLPMVDITESYLKFEMDRILTKYNNDRSERSTYVDGTSWYKVCWDSLDRTHKRSGDIKVDVFTVDQIIPQPGVLNYKDLEYIFERNSISITKIYDLYGRLVIPNGSTNMVDVISCYYINENGIVGLFMWAENSNIVICNEKDWQIRKLRKCKKCEHVTPIDTECPNCGGKSFKFDIADTEILAEDLYDVYNPYDEGETDEKSEEEHYQARLFATAGTEIPYYRIRQLPFVPRPAISSMDSIYGISEAFINMEAQDIENKVLTKAVDKTLKSGAILTKPDKIRVGDTDDTIKILSVRSAEESQMVNTKQVQADTSQDIVIAQMMYDYAKSASGVTDSFQGKRDTTATSGKAKMYAAAQTEGRIESLRVMKSAAFAGVYELIFKYLLAFSDEQRRFVKVLPSGKKVEQTWNKYMFLDKDENGNFYYRDDFVFGSDGAASLSQNRTSMWQETTDKFINGGLGNPAEMRTLKLYWNMMDQYGYPLAKTVLAGIEDNEQHLPEEIEQGLMQNQDALNAALAILQQGAEHRGGARANSGPAGNGATHAANVERTNERNRSQNREVIKSPQQM